MKLPEGGHALVDIIKLRDYCLSASHAMGRYKARVFASVLGITSADAVYLREELLRAACEQEAAPGVVDEYGARYTIDFEIVRGDRRYSERVDRAARRNGPTADQLLCTIELRSGMTEFEMLSVVALLSDLPEKGLLRGQVGAVVMALAPGVYEVEFVDSTGRTYALLPLRADELMQLHHEPSHQAA
jgi:uncharacterized protein DUF4926/uncharacterized protein DUF6883